jgi:tRNA(Arg) A34 adenosine deaminase TadA
MNTVLPRRLTLTLLLGLWPWWRAARAEMPDLRSALSRAKALRDEAVRAGDQAYGAVVWLDGRIDAHAEREALRDAQQRLGRTDLSGALLVSSSRPCALCEAAAARARIARMVHGDGTDGGPPQSR